MGHVSVAQGHHAGRPGWGRHPASASIRWFSADRLGLAFSCDTYGSAPLARSWSSYPSSFARPGRTIRNAGHWLGRTPAPRVGDGSVGETEPTTRSTASVKENTTAPRT